MGRAIVRDPQVFLMDAPLSNLDAKLRIQMRAEILRIQRRLSTTMVYVTHDQTEAIKLGDRVAVMRSGMLQQVGPPEELYDRPINVFVAGFIGSPGMNLLSGEITDGELVTALARIPLAMFPKEAGDAARAGPVAVGIRAGDFTDEPRAADRERSVSSRVMIDVVGSTGSDIFAHLVLDGTAAAGLTRRCDRAGRSGIGGHSRRPERRRRRPSGHRRPAGRRQPCGRGSGGRTLDRCGSAARVRSNRRRPRRALDPAVRPPGMVRMVRVFAG